MSPPPHDDNTDPAIDWLSGAKTISETRADTAPHDLGKLALQIEVAKAREDSCRSCFGEGQEDAISAFMLVFREHDMTDEEIAHTVLAARQKLTRL